MNQENILIVLLAILVLISAAQAVQLMEMSSPTDNTITGAVVSKASPQSQQQEVQIPSSLKNLPNMVGGC